MKPLAKLFLLLFAVVGVTDHASSAEKVPARCTARCKEQYSAIIKYNSDAFSHDEERQILRKAFGEPVRQSVGNADQLLRYRGKDFDYFELSDSAGKLKLLGVLATGNPAHARIPGLQMGEAKEPGKPTKWYFTANDLTLGYVLEDCPAGRGFVPSFRSTVLTQGCYFGKPGHYNYYAFQYSLVKQPCLKDVETLGLMEGLKKCPQHLPAMAVYIAEETVAEDARELAEFFASER
jgi:hypothetical protein